MTNKIVLTDSSTDEEMQKVFSLPTGSVFKVSGDFSIILNRLARLSPVGFEAVSIVPGVPLYTTYGPDHLIITCSPIGDCNG